MCFLSALWAKAQLDGYRPKIAEFSYEQINDAPITSNSELYGNAESEVENDALWKIKLAVPVIMKEGTLLALQFKSYRHKFYFDTEDTQGNYELFNEIDRRSVTSSGVGFIFKKDLNPKQQLCFIGGLNVKSDHFNWDRNSRQLYAGSIYTFQPNDETRFGFGLIAGSDLGVFSISPVFIYEKQIAKNWVLDLQLPKHLALRHKLNDKSYLIGKIEGNAWRYNLTDVVSSEQSQLTLRKVDLQLSLDYEREIHDWLWFGVSAGYNKNLNYYLSEPGERSRDALFQLNSRSAPTFKASIFLVPPRKFYK